jgi:hypothetical protein
MNRYPIYNRQRNFIDFFRDELLLEREKLKSFSLGKNLYIEKLFLCLFDNFIVGLISSLYTETESNQKKTSLEALLFDEKPKKEKHDLDKAFKLQYFDEKIIS